jgi:hypothetical protein
MVHSPGSDYVNCQGAIYLRDRQAEAAVKLDAFTAIIIIVCRASASQDNCQLIRPQAEISSLACPG